MLNCRNHERHGFIHSNRVLSATPANALQIGSWVISEVLPPPPNSTSLLFKCAVLVPMVDVCILGSIRERGIEIGTGVYRCVLLRRLCFRARSWLGTNTDGRQLDRGDAGCIHFVGIVPWSERIFRFVDSS